MIFNSTELNTQITVTETEGAVYFDLEEIAKSLGYSRPKKALKDFYQRNTVLLPNDLDKDIFKNQAEEWVVYLFLMQSDMPRALDFQLWVAKEVLPTVRRVGLRAIKKLEVQNALHQEQNTSRAELIALVKDESLVDEVINEWQCYRSLGFFPVSDYNIKPVEFYQWACQTGVFDAETGVPNPEYQSLMYSCDKYSNVYLCSRVWYAFKPELLDKYLQETSPPKKETPPEKFPQPETDLGLKL